MGLSLTLPFVKQCCDLATEYVFKQFMFHSQICALQWPRHVWCSRQRPCGHSKTSYWENCCTANPNRSFLLPGGVTLLVDYLQFRSISGYSKFLQPQSAPWAEAGWKYDLHVPLGVSKRDAQTEDTGSTQQQTHQRSLWGYPLPSQHYLLGSIQQQISHPALWSHGHLAPIQWRTNLSKYLPKSCVR